MAALEKSGFDVAQVREPVLDGLRRGHARARGVVRMDYAEAIKQLEHQEGIGAAIQGLFDSGDRARWHARYLLKDAEPAAMVVAAGEHLQQRRIDESRILRAANDLFMEMKGRSDGGALVSLHRTCHQRLDLLAATKESSARQREQMFHAMVLSNQGSNRPEVGALFARQFARAIDNGSPYWARIVLENGHLERYQAAGPDPESRMLVAGALMRLVQDTEDTNLRDAAARGLGIIAREVP
jgi:hypothetical protein